MPRLNDEPAFPSEEHVDNTLLYTGCTLGAEQIARDMLAARQPDQTKSKGK